jgi:hypothetical protein
MLRRAKTMNSKIKVEAHYLVPEYCEWFFDLPEGRKHEDIEEIDIKWANRVSVYFKDGTYYDLEVDPCEVELGGFGYDYRHPTDLTFKAGDEDDE